jgi:uncharacterized membrane protein HdeD (DUF308 family)
MGLKRVVTDHLPASGQVMTRQGAFAWTALVAAACSIVVTFKVGLNPDMRAIELVIGFIFLLLISWAAAGIVLLLSRFKARPLTLMIVSIAVSIVVSIWAIVQFAI